MSRENAEEVWAYCARMGYDAGINGPNTENCHFSIFSTPERTKAWERGHASGKANCRELEKMPR